MARPDPFVAADARAAGLARPGWIVTANRTADARGCMCIVPGDSSHEAIARMVELTIKAGIVAGVDELSGFEVEAPGGVLAEVLDAMALVMAHYGARGVFSPDDELGIAQSLIDAGAIDVPSSGRVH